jgi:hypothetical protein
VLVTRRRALTRERVVAEALTLISTGGAGALSTRALATRLGVVPARCTATCAAKSNCTTSSSTACWPRWAAGPTPPSRGPSRSPRSPSDCGWCSKTTPASPGCSRPATPLSPHSLALAEAFLSPLHAAGMPGPQVALAYRLIYDYTLGFALADRTSASEQRIQDAATCTPSCARCPRTRFPSWPPSAGMYGAATPANGSPSVWTPSSTASRRHCRAAVPEAARPTPDAHLAGCSRPSRRPPGRSTVDASIHPRASGALLTRALGRHRCPGPRRHIARRPRCAS